MLGAARCQGAVAEAHHEHAYEERPVQDGEKPVSSGDEALLVGLDQTSGAQQDVAECDQGQPRGVEALGLEVGDDPVDDEPPEDEQHGRRSEPDQVEEGDGYQVGGSGEHVEERGVELVRRVPADWAALGLEDLVEDPRFPARVSVLLEPVDQGHGEVQQQDPLDRGQLCPSGPPAVWGWRAPHPRRTSGA